MKIWRSREVKSLPKVTQPINEISGLKSCLPRAPECNHPIIDIVPQPSKPIAFHQLALFLQWIESLHGWCHNFNSKCCVSIDWGCLGHSHKYIQPESVRETLPCSSVPSLPWFHVNRDLQMMFLCTCWHPSFLIKTSSSATQLWHHAYAALSRIQTTALFCVSQLPFTEGFISSYPQTTFLGKDVLFPESWRWWVVAMMLCVHLWWTDFPLLLEEGISFHRCTNDV